MFVFFNNTFYGYGSLSEKGSGAMQFTHAGEWEMINNIFVDTLNLPFVYSPGEKSRSGWRKTFITRRSGKALQLLKTARAHGIPVIHAPLVVDPKKKKVLAYATFGRVFTKGAWKAEFTPDIVQTGDLIVQNRYAFDAFKGSNLEEILRQKDITKLLICGFTTDQCVAKTLRTGLRKKLRCFMVSDCTATIHSLLQWYMERRLPTIGSHDAIRTIEH